MADITILGNVIPVGIIQQPVSPVPAPSLVVTAGYGVYIPSFYDIALGQVIDVSLNAVLEIG